MPMTMPRFIFVQTQENRIALPPLVKYCDSFLCRLRGLAFRPALRADEGLLLVFGRDSRVDSSIHMLGVGFDLAVFWINNEMQVVDKIVAGAWKPAFFPKFPARYVLEVHASRIDDFEIGQTIQFQDA